jgi:hypothetical protein
MQTKEQIIDPSSLVVKKNQDFLKATGLNVDILQSAHYKFIETFQTECHGNNTCTAIAMKKYIENLTLMEQKAVIFYAMTELNKATHELAKARDKDLNGKKIIMPPKKV